MNKVFVKHKNKLKFRKITLGSRNGECECLFHTLKSGINTLNNVNKKYLF